MVSHLYVPSLLQSKIRKGMKLYAIDWLVRPGKPKLETMHFWCLDKTPLPLYLRQLTRVLRDLMIVMMILKSRMQRCRVIISLIKTKLDQSVPSAQKSIEKENLCMNRTTLNAVIKPTRNAWISGLRSKTLVPSAPNPLLFTGSA